jgi:hypothetical protein
MHGKTIRDKPLKTCCNECYVVFISAVNSAAVLIVGQGQAIILTSTLDWGR